LRENGYGAPLDFGLLQRYRYSGYRPRPARVRTPRIRRACEERSCAVRRTGAFWRRQLPCPRGADRGHVRRGDLLRQLLAHMPSREDLLLAARSIRSRLKEGRLLLASISDYDRTLREGPAATVPKVMDALGAIGSTSRRGTEKTTGTPTPYTCSWLARRNGVGKRGTIRRATGRFCERSSTTCLHEAGFVEIVWRMLADSGSYQPIVAAKGR